MIRNYDLLSEREEVVLSILWKHAESGNYPICREVIDDLKEEYKCEYAETTVYTFLKNLIKKGYVEDRRDKGVKFYVPIKSKEEYLEKVLERMNKIYFNNNKKDFIKAIKSIDM